MLAACCKGSVYLLLLLLLLLLALLLLTPLSPACQPHHSDLLSFL
jgi:hypothetical protein